MGARAWSRALIPFSFAFGPHLFRKLKKNSRFTSQESKYFNLQAHDPVLLTTVGMM